MLNGYARALIPRIPIRFFLLLQLADDSLRPEFDIAFEDIPAVPCVVFLTVPTDGFEILFSHGFDFELFEGARDDFEGIGCVEALIRDGHMTALKMYIHEFLTGECVQRFAVSVEMPMFPSKHGSHWCLGHIGM